MWKPVRILKSSKREEDVFYCHADVFYCVEGVVFLSHSVVYTWICSGVHWSRLTDLTLEMCTPRLRWMPAQRIHMNTPRFHEAHRGPEKEKDEEMFFFTFTSY